MERFNEIARDATRAFLANSDAGATLVGLRDQQGLLIQNHITDSISKAIPTALHILIRDHMVDINHDAITDGIYKEASVRIGPFCYGVTPYRSQPDSPVTLHPSFIYQGFLFPEEMMTKKTFKMEPTEMGLDVLDAFVDKTRRQDLLYKAVSNYLQWQVYDPALDAWVQNTPLFLNLKFSTSDIRKLLAIHAMTVMHSVYTRRMTRSVTLPEGTYTLVPGKFGTKQVEFMPSKYYKMLIKDDSLELAMT